MNYVQVTSTALQLQADWHSLLEGLLSIQGILDPISAVDLRVCAAVMAGFFTEVVSVPFECNFDRQGTPPSIAALWMRLAVPWIILFSLNLIFLLFWYVVKQRSSRSFLGQAATPFTNERLMTCLIVISVVTVYFSYIDFVKELFRAVNCISIKDSSEIVSADHSYVRYALEPQGQQIWAENTDLVCFEGQHLAVGIVGIVGLALSASAVLFIVFLLPLRQKHVTETEFVARYWFFYQAYRKHWYTIAWESTILVRKALIAAVAVFGFRLGASLQAALCVGILIIFHALHSLFAPFKVPEEHVSVPQYAGSTLCVPYLKAFSQRWVQFQNKIHLNHLESVSLTGSILVFLSGVVLQDDNASSSGRTAISVFAFLVNVCFLVFLLYRLYAGCHVVIDLRLEMANPNFVGTHKESMGPLSLMQKIFAWVQAQPDLSRRASDQSSHR